MSSLLHFSLLPFLELYFKSLAVWLISEESHLLSSLSHNRLSKEIGLDRNPGAGHWEAESAFLV